MSANHRSSFLCDVKDDLYGGRDVRININDINIINIYDFSLISMIRTFLSYALIFIFSVSWQPYLKERGKASSFLLNVLDSVCGIPRLSPCPIGLWRHFVWWRLVDIVFTLVFRLFLAPYTQMDVDGLEQLLRELHRDLHLGKGIAEVLTNLFRFVLLKPTFL